MDSSYLIQAIARCEQAVAAKSDNPEALPEAFADLGNLLQGMGQFDRAIVWHSLALESDANLGEVYCQLGELYILESNWSAALGCFEKAIEYLPNSAKVYASLAQIHGQLQHKEAEMDCWYQAVQINPNLVNNSGYYKLAKALEQRRKIDQAVFCYQKATEGKQGLLGAWFDLGDIYQRQLKLDSAQTAYGKILAVEPTAARAQYKLGTIHLQKREFEQAIDCFRQTIKNAPELPWAYRDLVRTFLILQRWDEAISTCYAILNLVEEYPWVYSHLGNALREKGKLAEAAKNFQKACASRGWQKCLQRDYFFTRDLFSHRIDIWSECLQSLSQSSGVNALEVGFYQGMSACWLLDYILRDESDRLTCIDLYFPRQFQQNLVKAQAETKVNCLKGDTQEQLASLSEQSFDLINLQDRSKLANDVEQTTQLAWKLLKPQGIMIFNYYGFRDPANAQHNPKLGIDRFLGKIKDQWEQVHLSLPTFQLIVRKL